jgi:anti-sigma-K factor RskA
MGLLLPSVKRRVEKLMQQDASFEQEVIAWQERLAPLNDVPDPKPAPAFVKDKVMAKIQGKPASQVSKLTAWWQSLWFWQGLSAASMALFIVIAIAPFNENTDQLAKLSYIAVMQSDTTAGEAPLVVSAYAKTEDDPSRLELRWNDRTDRESVEQTTLWAVERETGNITPLMQLAAGMQSVNLDAQQWQAVKNSLELVVVKGTEFDGEVVLRGVCIQLADWNKA